MQKKAIIATLCALVLTIVASVTLILTVGQRTSATTNKEPFVLDQLDDFNINENGVLTGLSDKAWEKLSRNNIGESSGWFWGSGDDQEIWIKIPESVKAVKHVENWNYGSVIPGGEMVTVLELPEGLEEIGNSAFYEYRGITELTIPSTVTSIGRDAFHGCYNLKTVKILGNPVIAENAFWCDYELKTIYCGASQADATDKLAENWNKISSQWNDETSTYEVVFAEVKWGYNKTITFDTVGGGNVENQTVFMGNTVSKPTDPNKAGYNFKGWFNGTEAYDFSKPVESDLTLTAQWEKIMITPDPVSPEDQTVPEQQEEQQPTEQENNQEQQESKNNGAVVAAVAGTTTGVAGLTAVGTIVAVVLKRRRK